MMLLPDAQHLQLNQLIAERAALRDKEYKDQMLLQDNGNGKCKGKSKVGGK